MVIRQDLQRKIAHIGAGLGCQGWKVIFNMSMKLQIKKTDFLSKLENKRKFHSLLGDKLCVSGCEVQHATSDADVLIVQTAV